MPILTKPVVTKNAASSFTLNKSLLAAHTLVAADAYFSDMSKWKNVIMYFESQSGSQSEKVVFDATEETPIKDFLVSVHAEDIFEITRIDIYDFDGGHMSVPRTELETSEYDLDLSVEDSDFSVWDLQQGVVASGSSVSKLQDVIGVAPDEYLAKSTLLSAEADFEYTFTLKTSDIGNAFVAGICFNDEMSPLATAIDGWVGVISNLELEIWVLIVNQIEVSPQIPFGTTSTLIIKRIGETTTLNLNGFIYTDTTHTLSRTVYPFVRPLTNGDKLESLDSLETPPAFYTRDFSNPDTAQDYDAIFNNLGQDTPSLISDGRVAILGSTSGYRNSDDSFSFVEGVSYKFRIYIDEAADNFGLTLDVGIGGVYTGGTIARATIVAAVGSFIEIPFVATAPQAASLERFRLEPASQPLYVSKVEILEVVVDTFLEWTPRADYTFEEDGGMTSTNVDGNLGGVAFADADVVDTDNDFELIYNFDCDPFALISFIGYSDAAKGIFSGLYRNYGGHELLINNNSYVGIITPMTTGNVIKFSKVGSNLKITLNDVDLYDDVSSVLQASIIPAIRLMSVTEAITSATINQVV